jgi:predicted ATPase
MHEIEEAQASLAALAESEEVKAAEAQRRQRLKLQTSLGQAMVWSRGFGSNESMTAFARARTLAAGIDNASERFDVYNGLFTGSLLRGELNLARATAESFLREAENAGRTTEASLARRHVGHACLYQGDFIEARNNIAEALRTYDPERDRDAKFRFGAESGACATGFLTQAIWALGDVERARALSDEALARADETAHAPTRATVFHHISLYHMLRGDPEAARRMAKVRVDVSREHGMALYLAYGELYLAWARAQLDDRETGVSELRRTLSSYLDDGNKLHAPLFQGPLAELEAEGDDAGAALRRIDEALAVANETGVRWTDPLLHRIRGAILLKRDPTNPGAGEEALLAAITIAQAQKARSFELRAAVSLARLYESTGRPVDAHAILSSAIEGFTPTPEMHEIEEAQALLAALAESEEVKAAEAQRQQRLRLHVSYGNALFAARGPSAPETRQAFARVRAQALRDHGALEQLAADYGLWVARHLRGELQAMRAHAAAFLADVESKPDSPEAGVAHRTAGVTHWFAGEYQQARDHLERALALFEPGRDDDLAIVFGLDTGVSAMANLPHWLWPLGEVDRAISLVERMLSRVADLTHVGTLAFAWQQAAMFELIRGDSVRAAQNVSELGRVLREHDLSLFRAFHLFLDGWASGRLTDMRRAIELLREQNVLWFDGPVKIVLAEAEARAGDAVRAVVVLDEALATCNRIGHRAFEAELHRVRGDLLLKRDPANPATAEEALQTALAIAREQGSRSFELRAALSLARLLQSTGRVVEAHAMLEPALEGFSPTSEMHEIEEAQASLAALAESEEVKAEAVRQKRREQLQLNMATALFQSRGMHSTEAGAAFERAGDLIAAADPMQRLAILYGQAGGALGRGEIRRMLDIAASMAPVAAREASEQGALVARRILGLAQFFAGDLAEAAENMQWTVDHSDFERDHGLAVRFAHDQGVGARYYLAFAKWILGDAQAAFQLVGEGKRLAERLRHPPTTVAMYAISAWLDMVRSDPLSARSNAEAVLALAREFELALWRAQVEFVLAWSQGALEGTRAAWDGAEAQWAASLALSGPVEPMAAYIGAGYAALGDFDHALTLVDRALGAPVERGLLVFTPEAHRVRGEILRKRDPADPAPAEQALKTALATAREQGSRSFELRAALSLAKLYQSTGRPADAHAILSSAVEGFTLTSDMPEIAEAQALLAPLAETDEVKTVEAARQRRLQLQTRYGQAMMYSRGYGSEESKAAFARARTLAAGVGDASERFDAYYGLFVGSVLRGELSWRGRSRRASCATPKPRGGQWRRRSRAAASA